MRSPSSAPWACHPAAACGTTRGPVMRRRARARRCGKARWRMRSAARMRSHRVDPLPGHNPGSRPGADAVLDRAAFRAMPPCRVMMGERIGALRPTCRPAYCTITRSAVSATTPRSCVINTNAMPCSRRNCVNNSRICAWIVTSSAVVGSSAISKRGLQASAIAIITRWFMPPDNWCGNADVRRAASECPPARATRPRGCGARADRASDAWPAPRRFASRP